MGSRKNIILTSIETKIHLPKFMFFHVHKVASCKWWIKFPKGYEYKNVYNPQASWSLEYSLKYSWAIAIGKLVIQYFVPIVSSKDYVIHCWLHDVSWICYLKLSFPCLNSLSCSCKIVGLQSFKILCSLYSIWWQVLICGTGCASGCYA